MIPADTLDGLLTLVAAIWIALSVTIVVDRNRYDRRMRRATALQTRLRLAPCSDRCSTPATRPPCSGAFASLGGWARPSGCRGSGS